MPVCFWLSLLLTFSHVSVSRHSTSLSSHLAGSSGGQAGQADTLLQIGLTVQFQERDVVVQGLGVVIVVDVGGGDAEGLGTGTAELLGQVVVPNADVDGVTGTNNTEKSEKVLS